jgi:hypothetical protein
MARTNEDAVVLATARVDDTRLLIVRHLPDRGTVEFGWWQKDEAGTPAQGQVLELAAEAAEVEGFASLCRQALERDAAAVAEGGSLASAGPFVDGADLVALNTEGEVTLVRHPEPDNLIRMSRDELALLAEMLPAAREKLDSQGFGLPQQDG